MSRRKSEIPPEQGRLPLDLPIRERYDPGDENTNGSRGRRKSASIPEDGEQLSLTQPEIAEQIMRDNDSLKWKLNEEKKDEKPISASVDSIDDQNPFVDQFCEQLARIIAKGKASGKSKTGGNNESSRISKSEH